MVDDAPPFLVQAGSTIYVPQGIFHSTRNTGWQPMRLLALYNPAGAEKALAGRVVERERSEEHTSELQSQSNLVCRLLLEKKKKKHTSVTALTGPGNSDP